MWWVAVLIPVVILAIVIAVAPVAYGSVHFHRWHNRRVPRRPVETTGSSVVRSNVVRSKRRVRCPVCLAAIEGDTANEVITSRNEHFLETHVTTETPSTELEQGNARSA